MIFTGEIDYESLRQELVAAVGAEGWYLNGSAGRVEFVQTADGVPDPTPTIEAHIANAPARVAAKAKEPIIEQIVALEDPQSYMRMLRETALVCIEDLATRLAEQMTANGTPTTQADVLADQYGYQKAKALDERIRALRMQL